MRQPSFGSKVTVGHWSDPAALTGCTVVLFDQLTRATVDVRGAAPGTRETDLLRPGQLVQRVDAILLAGGSAFGLAAADGVVRFLESQGRGFPTPARPVPIVPAAVIYDLSVGEAVWPDTAAGYAACLAAKPLLDMERGQVGAGTGATTGKAWGNAASRGGIGRGSESWSGGSVTALVVVNALGDVVNPGSGPPLAGADCPSNDRRREILTATTLTPGLGESTSLGVVIVESSVDQTSLHRCAIAAHDGFARAIRPCHTIFDGDLVFAVALREAPEPLPPLETLQLTVATELAVEAAIIDAVTA